MIGPSKQNIPLNLNLDLNHGDREQLCSVHPNRLRNIWQQQRERERAPKHIRRRKPYGPAAKRHA